MGAISGMLGTHGGAAGTGFAGPQGTSILPGTDAAKLQAGYEGTQNSLESQQALLQALQAQGGLGNQAQVYNQLQGVAAGTGPNPAQAMLANATGANVANQAALMAGQRGAGANPALLARQAAMQGAGIQQNALGQAAALQAQQSLGAIGQAGAMATQQAGQQIGQTNANLQGQLSQQQLQQQAAAAQNQANVAMQSNINNANAGLAGQAMQGQQKTIGGAMSGAGMAMGMAEGGSVPGTVLQAMGASLQDKPFALPPPKDPIFGGSFEALPAAMNTPMSSTMMAAQGGIAGPMSSVGQYLKGMAHGGNVGSSLKAGGHVPGQAAHPGNNYSNDTVNAKLSPGELVVDRETMNDKGKAGDAARFLAAVIAAKKKGKS